MNYTIDVEISTAEQLRTHIVEEGVLLSSGMYSPIPILTDIISESDRRFRLARECFPTDEVLHHEMCGYITSCFNKHVNADEVLGDAEKSYDDRLRSLGRSFRDFVETEPRIFSSFCSICRISAAPESFDSSLDECQYDPLFGIILEIVRQEMQRQDRPKDMWLWLSTSATIYAGLIGIEHLSTRGIARHLLPAGKRQICSSMVRHLSFATLDVIKSGRVLGPAPHPFVNPEKYVVPPAHKLPISTKEDRGYALFRSAAELTKLQHSAPTDTTPVAERIGLQSNAFNTFLDFEREFVSELEDFLNQEVNAVFLEQIHQLPAGTVPYLYGVSPGTSYACLSIVDPLSFQVLSMISSGSIVPVSLERNLGNFEMGRSLRTLFEQVKMNIDLGGGPGDSWTLFETTVSLWAVVHGIAILVSSGSFLNLPHDYRFELVHSVVDLSSSSMVRRLELTLPGVSDI